MAGIDRPGTGFKVLLVDDDESFRRGIRRLLERDGFEVADAPSGETSLLRLDDVEPDLVVLDMNMPGISGIDTLRALRSRRPELPVVMLTGDADVGKVVEAIRSGAFDYLQKPPDVTRLRTTLHNALEKARLAARVAALERDAAGDWFGMVGASPSMVELFRQLEQVGPRDVTVLIGGESGSGKELVARAIHASSRRAAHPFVAINCAAMAESLVESELFGHERGAFTGAIERHMGRFEQANHGTLFLDEVGELTAGLQAKLLRVVQERRFFRVGGTVGIDVDVRLLAATHRNLLADVHAGRFREDLYYRLAVYEVEVPPLRARVDDIPRLASRFVETLGRRHDNPGLRLSPRALDLLMNHDWPGNVRELHNAVERAVVVARSGVIEPEDFHQRLHGASVVERVRPAAPPAVTPPPATPPPALPPAPAPVAAPALTRRALREKERDVILAALERHEGNVTEVVRELGIPRSTLYRRLRGYGVR